MPRNPFDIHRRQLLDPTQEAQQTATFTPPKPPAPVSGASAGLPPPRPMLPSAPVFAGGEYVGTKPQQPQQGGASGWDAVKAGRPQIGATAQQVGNSFNSAGARAVDTVRGQATANEYRDRAASQVAAPEGVAQYLDFNALMAQAGQGLSADANAAKRDAMKQDFEAKLALDAAKRAAAAKAQQTVAGGEAAKMESLPEYEAYLTAQEKAKKAWSEAQAKLRLGASGGGRMGSVAGAAWDMGGGAAGAKGSKDREQAALDAAGAANKSAQEIQQAANEAKKDNEEAAAKAASEAEAAKSKDAELKAQKTWAYAQAYAEARENGFSPEESKTYAMQKFSTNSDTVAAGAYGDQSNYYWTHSMGRDLLNSPWLKELEGWRDVYGPEFSASGRW